MAEVAAEGDEAPTMSSSGTSFAGASGKSGSSPDTGPTHRSCRRCRVAVWGPGTPPDAAY
jgi:hypothetical protein